MKCHIPDLTTQMGLVDIMAVGNFLELAQYMDRRYYTGNLPSDDLEEQRVARANYHIFQKLFVERYSVLMEGKLISPFLLFQRSFIEFAAALVSYKTVAEEYTPYTEGCTPKKLGKEISGLITEDYPELSSAFHRVLVEQPLHFHWTGPSFTIRLRQPSDRVQEAHDFDNWKVFDDPDSDEEGEDDAAEEEEDSLPVLPAPEQRGKKRRNDGESSITAKMLPN
jgi:hypothetical protein